MVLLIGPRSLNGRAQLEVTGLNPVEGKKSLTAMKKLIASVAHTIDERMWLRKLPGKIQSGKMVPGQ